MKHTQLYGRSKRHTIIVDRPMDWVGLWVKLKPVLTYIIGIVTGVVITLSSHYHV